MNQAGEPGSGPPVPSPDAPRATEAYGSIIERFRGTQWDTRSGIPEPPKPSPAGPLIAIGAVALALVGGLTLVSVLSRPVSSAPPPSHVIVTPAPTPGPAAILLEAFWTEVQRPTFAYHMTIESKVTQATDTVLESVTLDVRGEDFSGTMNGEVKPGGPKLTFVVLRSGGVLYTKQPGDKTWTNAVTAGQVELRPRPFLTLDDTRELIVSGVETHDGVVLNRLVSTQAYRPPLTRLMPLALGILPTAVSNLVILVDDEGRPVTATLTVHVPADPSTGDPAIDGTATYTFTKVDQIDPIPSPVF